MSIPTIYPTEVNLSTGPTDSLPRYTTVESVLTPQSGNVISDSGSITTTGTDEVLVNIPMTALGYSLFNSPHLLLSLETSADVSAAATVGYGFAVTSTDLSNVNVIKSRPYTTDISPLYMSTSTFFSLSREKDYPEGTSNLAVYVISVPATNMPSSNVLNYSYSLSSVQ